MIGCCVLVAVQEEERQEREHLRQEWVQKQEKLKGEYVVGGGGGGVGKAGKEKGE